MPRIFTQKKRINKVKNKHGLDRNIPLATKRIIRQRDGFGCIICGLGIIEYEHVDPEFKDAEVHDPNCITVLCPNCHSKVTTGMWSKEKIKAAMENPKCISNGFSKEIFDIGSGFPVIKIADTIFTKTRIPIQIFGSPLFEIIPAQNNGEPFLLSANFFDSQGKNSLNIIENEWQAATDNWDVEVIGSTLTIRENSNKIHLQIEANPPDTLIVSQMHMLLNGLEVKADKTNLRISDPNTGQFAEFKNCKYTKCHIGINITPLPNTL